MSPDVLVLRALGLGDALTGVAALRGVRRAFPGSRLVLAGPVGVGEWLRGLGVVDDVLGVDGVHGVPETLPWDGRGRVAVNLHGRGPESHRALLATSPERLVAFACDAVGHAGPAWPADEHEVDRWCRLAHAVGGECSREDLRLAPGRGGARTGPVVLHPGAASGARRWPVARWSEVAARLAAAGHDVVVSGGAGERDLADAVVAGADEVRVAAVGAGAAGSRAAGVRSVAGTLGLAGLADLVAGARLVVCGDTGVAHLATALATPSVLLFGPTAPTTWGPAVDPELHTVLWHGDPARPGDPHAAALDPALAAITVDEVLAATEAHLGARQMHAST